MNEVTRQHNAKYCQGSIRYLTDNLLFPGQKVFGKITIYTLSRFTKRGVVK